jgi:hypothetical protein
MEFSNIKTACRQLSINSSVIQRTNIKDAEEETTVTAALGRPVIITGIRTTVLPKKLVLEVYKMADFDGGSQKVPNGSRGRARTCNPPVNSRLLYH